jgi:hypothetical protein
VILRRPVFSASDGVTGKMAIAGIPRSAAFELPATGSKSIEYRVTPGIDATGILLIRAGNNKHSAR